MDMEAGDTLVTVLIKCWLLYSEQCCCPVLVPLPFYLQYQYCDCVYAVHTCDMSELYKVLCVCTVHSFACSIGA